MTSIPDPLVPAEVDLQDFAFMPLHVARLRDSNLAAEEEPETCWYAVLLWAASWHQIPAGSLPDNDTVLMRLVGLGRDKKTWAKHRAGALRGFVLCSDGRLYHPVVAETALESWNGKLRQRHGKFCAAVRQHNKRHPDNVLTSPSFDEWEALGRPERVTETITDQSRENAPDVTRDSSTKGQGQCKGQGDSSITVEPDGSTGAGAPKAQPDDVGDAGFPAPASDRPIDLTKAVFDSGVRILAAAGKPEREARTMLGLWRSKHGDGAVLAVLSRCDAEQPSDPIAWITRGLQAEARKATGNGHGSNSPRRAPDGSIAELERRIRASRAGPDAGEAERRGSGEGGPDRGLALPAPAAVRRG